MFDPHDRSNTQKISHLLRQNFEGQTLEIPDALVPYVTRSRLVDLLDFSRVEFEKVISLSTAPNVFLFESKWQQKSLHEVAMINSSKSELKNISNELTVSFVEMASVSEKGFIERTEDRQIGDLKKGGYTYFSENDVLIAKITPCMENGKSALARNLKNGIGFGSTEFHVLRVIAKQLHPGYLFAFLNRQEVRHIAEQNMTGASGHRRVPESFYIDLKIPVPPSEYPTTHCSGVLSGGRRS